MRQQYLYYQLLKFSGQGTSAGDALDKAVDRLCESQLLELSEVPVKLRLTALKQVCQAMLGNVSIEIHQRLMEVSRSLTRAKEDSQLDCMPAILLGRALEAAGVAYGIQSYIDQNSKFLESRVYKTQGLNHLLANYGAEVVKAVAANIDSFTATYMNYTLAAHAKLLGLGAMRKANLGAYRVLSARSNASWHQQKIKEYSSDTRSTSMCLDSKMETCQSSSHHSLLGRRSFSLDVRAGADKFQLDAVPA